MPSYDSSTASLHRAAFTTRFPSALGAMAAAPLSEWLTATVELENDDALRAAVRALLREGGYKPSGRGKPSSEYLLRAVTEDRLPSINPAVDAGNAASFHSGMPMSVVDLGRSPGPHRVAIPDPAARYVFNASGQEIALAGLLCLIDAQGPCANAVKDSQRTKTDAATTRTLSVVWGPAAFADRVEAALQHYRSLLHGLGAETERVA